MSEYELLLTMANLLKSIFGILIIILIVLAIFLVFFLERTKRND